MDFLYKVVVLTPKKDGCASIECVFTARQNMHRLQYVCILMLETSKSFVNRHKLSLTEERFFIPVSPPVHFEEVENRNAFSGRAIYEQLLFSSGRFREQNGCTAKHVHSYERG